MCAWSSLRADESAAEPKHVEREAKRGEPVGGTFLGPNRGWQTRLAPAMGEGPPLLFMLSRAQLASSRWSWELPALTKALAEELAAVLDDGCASGCAAEAHDLREKLRALLDDSGNLVEGARRTKSWITDEAGYHTTHRSLGVSLRAGALALDADCTCHSNTVGMRVWNDVTTCELVVRERGRELARYLPLVALGEGKLSDFFPLETFRQTVRFPDGGQLIIESGYEYEGDGKNRPYTKKSERGKVIVVGKLIAR